MQVQTQPTSNNTQHNKIIPVPQWFKNTLFIVGAFVLGLLAHDAIPVVLRFCVSLVAEFFYLIQQPWFVNALQSISSIITIIAAFIGVYAFIRNRIRKKEGQKTPNSTPP